MGDDSDFKQLSDFNELILDKKQEEEKRKKTRTTRKYVINSYGKKISPILTRKQKSPQRQIPSTSTHDSGAGIGIHLTAQPHLLQPSTPPPPPPPPSAAPS